MKSSDPHRITVTVDANQNVVCDPEHVAVTDRCNAVLKFVLQTDGYVFPEQDAVVVTNPGKQFPFPSRTLPKHPTRATLYDDNSVGGAFKYSVYVKDAATGKILMVDPVINNEP
ncbi:MAG: hypothetical protein ABI781_13455 [Burkholderiales bacterium]